MNKYISLLGIGLVGVLMGCNSLEDSVSNHLDDLKKYDYSVSVQTDDSIVSFMWRFYNFKSEAD